VTDSNEQPRSLGHYRVSEDREALIKTHIAMLSETAVKVSEQLRFDADVSEVIGALEANADDDAQGAR
jgi:hypothetical protein